MLFDSPMVVYLISPQPWDGLRVSKHHYATELAKLGHTVFFIEPPNATAPSQPRVSMTEVERVFRVSYRTWFPYGIKFRTRRLFNLLMRRQARLIRQAIGRQADLVWDFDNAYQFSDLNVFRPAFKILHLVDYVAKGRFTDKNANIFCAITEQLLTEVRSRHAIKLQLGHAIGDAFSNLAREVSTSDTHVQPDARPLRAAMFGNLDHRAVDWITLERAVLEHPTVQFHFIGPYDHALADKSEPWRARARLIASLNCRFTGPMSQADLVAFAKSVDIWMLCYDRRADGNNGSNSHKILEYMATGAVTVASKIDAHIGSRLMVMCSQNENSQWPELFDKTVANILDEDSLRLRKERAQFAAQYTYDGYLREIDRLIRDTR